jgi:hypothetical protein
MSEPEKFTVIPPRFPEATFVTISTRLQSVNVLADATEGKIAQARRALHKKMDVFFIYYSFLVLG